MFMESGTGSGRAAAKPKGKKHSCSGRCGGEGPCAQNTAHQLAESLGRAVDARDRRLFQHSEMVAEISSLLAQAHGLTPRQTTMVHMAAHLHDVGKIGIPDHILHKPGPLSPDEWAIMRQHPRMLRDVEVARHRRRKTRELAAPPPCVQRLDVSVRRERTILGRLE